MRIRVLEQKNDLTYFSSQYGTGFGMWEDVEKPLKQDYSIEFGFYEKIDSNHIRLSQGNSPKITILDNNKMMITGKVIQYDAKTMIVDIGEGFIYFYILEDVPGKDLYNKYVDIIVDNIGLYDEHYD